MITDPFAVPTLAAPTKPPARKLSQRPKWLCGWCEWETDELCEDGLPPHQAGVVTRATDGTPKVVEKWCVGGGHLPEAVTR